LYQGTAPGGTGVSEHIPSGGKKKKKKKKEQSVNIEHQVKEGGKVGKLTKGSSRGQGKGGQRKWGPKLKRGGITQGDQCLFEAQKKKRAKERTKKKTAAMNQAPPFQNQGDLRTEKKEGRLKDSKGGGGTGLAVRERNQAKSTFNPKKKKNQRG